jgi:Flp pilus assembly protein TadG
MTIDMIRPGIVLAALRRNSGNAAIEFVLIAPLLISALVAVTDLGIALYERMEIRNAAQAGAQYAIAKGWDSGAIENAVAGASTLSGISATPAPTQSCGCVSGTAIVAAACGSLCPGGVAAGTYVTVNAQAQYATLFSYPGLANPLTLSAQSMVRIQ